MRTTSTFATAYLAFSGNGMDSFGKSPILFIRENHLIINSLQYIYRNLLVNTLIYFKKDGQKHTNGAFKYIFMLKM